MPKDPKPKGGMSAGLLPSLPQTAAPLVTSGNTENDTIPSYMYFIKAIQDGNGEAASQALKHVQDSHGAQTATQLAFLGHQMKNSNINDIAKRNIGLETNPQMRKLYATINENPDLIDKFQYSMPTNQMGLANWLSGR